MTWGNEKTMVQWLSPLKEDPYKRSVLTPNEIKFQSKYANRCKRNQEENDSRSTNDNASYCRT